MFNKIQKAIQLELFVMSFLEWANLQFVIVTSTEMALFELIWLNNERGWFPWMF